MVDNITTEDMVDNITTEDMEDNITIEDVEDNIQPTLKRDPDLVIIHVDTNNANNITSREILNKLLQLKSPIIDKYKIFKVILSQPTL